MRGGGATSAVRQCVRSRRMLAVRGGGAERAVRGCERPGCMREGRRGGLTSAVRRRVRRRRMCMVRRGGAARATCVCERRRRNLMVRSCGMVSATARSLRSRWATVARGGDAACAVWQCVLRTATAGSGWGVLAAPFRGSARGEGDGRPPDVLRCAVAVSRWRRYRAMQAYVRNQNVGSVTSGCYWLLLVVVAMLNVP